MTSKTAVRLTDTGCMLLVAVCGAVLHALLNGQYGFHRDELDIILNARRLDWGYVAYPPLTPLVARVGLELFGPSLAGLRLFSALGQGVVMFLTGLMARDLGGKRPAQVMAAFAVYMAPVALTSGTLIQYMAFDYVWWVMIAFFTTRLLRTDDARYWLGIGAGIGLGMLTKYTLAFWVAGLVVAVLLTPARRYLRSPWLWAGAGLALLIYAPNLLWQIQHHLVAWDYLNAIHARDIAWGRTNGFWPEQLYVATNPFTFPLWAAGLVWYLFNPSGKRFRALGLMFLTTLALLALNRGRAYYVGPAYAVLLAAGAAWLAGWLESRAGWVRRAGQGAAWALLILGGIAGIVLVKPVAPINSALWQTTSKVNGEVVEMIGWPDLAAQVAGVYAKLPAGDKARAAVWAGNYGEAGALDLYGADYGLPRMISGANSLWERGYGNPEPETVIVVGFERGYADSFFKSCEYAGQVTNRHGVKNEETRAHTGLYICREPRQAWAEMWKTMRWFQ